MAACSSQRLSWAKRGLEATRTKLEDTRDAIEDMHLQVDDGFECIRMKKKSECRNVKYHPWKIFRAGRSVGRKKRDRALFLFFRGAKGIIRNKLGDTRDAIEDLHLQVDVGFECIRMKKKSECYYVKWHP